MPDTPSDSSVMAVSSASDCCVRFASRWRRLPTRTCTTTKIGITISEMMVSCQLSSTMEMNAAMTVTTFCRMVVAVEVSTLRTPATSLASRDWMSPVRVEVKNASSIFCRC